jgi:hypothetical protein
MRIILYPEDGGSKFLQNIGTFIYDENESNVCWSSSTRLHGIIFQKTVILIFISVRSSNPRLIDLFFRVHHWFIS